MKKILVTGGAGFIGSHLVKKLIKENIIFCLDNLHTGSFLNIEEFNKNDHFHFITHDLIHEYSIDVDEIYHLACPASPKNYLEDPLRTANTAILGTINILELAKKTNAKLLIASTSEVYGDPSISPQPEEYQGNVSIQSPRACYNEAKRATEMYAYIYKNKFNLDIKVARIFNTYGPNMQPDDGRVISNFITQALRNEDITIFGDGEQTRSFCYISDMIIGLTKLMTSSSEIPINLGNPDEIKIIQLANLIREITSSSSKIVYQSLPIDDPKQRCPDIRRAKSLLNFNPEVNLQTGLIESIEYFRNQI